MIDDLTTQLHAAWTAGSDFDRQYLANQIRSALDYVRRSPQQRDANYLAKVTWDLGPVTRDQLNGVIRERLKQLGIRWVRADWDNNVCGSDHIVYRALADHFVAQGAPAADLWRTVDPSRGPELVAWLRTWTPTIQQQGFLLAQVAKLKRLRRSA